MSGFDSNVVTSANLQLQDFAEPNQSSNPNNLLASPTQLYSQSHVKAQDAFIRFIRTFRVNDESINSFIYRDQLTANYKQQSYYLNVDMSMYLPVSLSHTHLVSVALELLSHLLTNSYLFTYLPTLTHTQ